MTFDWVVFTTEMEAHREHGGIAICLRIISIINLYPFILKIFKGLI